MNSIVGLLQLDILANRSTEKNVLYGCMEILQVCLLGTPVDGFFFSFCLPFIKKMAAGVYKVGSTKLSLFAAAPSNKTELFIETLVGFSLQFPASPIFIHAPLPFWPESTRRQTSSLCTQNQKKKNIQENSEDQTEPSFSMIERSCLLARHNVLPLSGRHLLYKKSSITWRVVVVFAGTRRTLILAVNQWPARALFDAAMATAAAVI